MDPAMRQNFGDAHGQIFQVIREAVISATTKHKYKILQTIIHTLKIMTQPPKQTTLYQAITTPWQARKMTRETPEVRSDKRKPRERKKKKKNERKRKKKREKEREKARKRERKERKREKKRDKGEKQREKREIERKERNREKRRENGREKEIKKKRKDVQGQLLSICRNA